MIVTLARAADPRCYMVDEDGHHSFPTEVPGERALFHAPLTGAQVLFLSRHLGAVRCCVAKAAFPPAWLNALIAAVEAPPPSTGARH